MALLWTPTEAYSEEPEWSAWSLCGDQLLLVSARGHGAVAVLHAVAADGGGSRWAVLEPPGAGVSVSGRRVRAGVRLLDDRDSIDVAGQPSLSFSIECLAEVVALPEAVEPVFCARCKSLIAPGSPAVSCPGRGCGAWHCCDTEHPCWLYSERCAHCEHPTALDAGYQWSPASL